MEYKERFKQSYDEAELKYLRDRREDDFVPRSSVVYAVIESFNELGKILNEINERLTKLEEQCNSTESQEPAPSATSSRKQKV